MFTGIIEDIGKVIFLKKEFNNLHIGIKSTFYSELKIDQSISHNGICLTVVHLKNSIYTVTAIKETLDKTNLNTIAVGDLLNLERAMKLGDRLDGHIVQGHIDQTGVCVAKKNENGSWIYTFTYNSSPNNITIEKGSITINGISLTVLDSINNTFSVAIIPYTYDNTSINTININDIVNLEFDVIGKYVAKLHAAK
ncbi:MAG: riboflavin synthase [Flavobacteriaceae bacterium]|nr:riboflavin synthase [Flavobacteriaceae bacterium]